MTEELEVRLLDEPIGVLRRAPRRGRSFVSLEDTITPSSRVRLAEAFSVVAGRRPDVTSLSRFLGGYLPEGAQREAMAARRRIERNDLFGFLREFGTSIAGALTFRDPSDAAARSAWYAPLPPRILHRELRRAGEEHDQGVRDDSRSMLAGFQPKLLVARFDGGPWQLPHGGAHSTHILKPRLASRPSRIFDEYVSHQLSRAVGLSAFASEILGRGDNAYLAIERFDRTVRAGEVSVVHQEDAAQALGIDWIDDDFKFQSPDRPDDPRRPSAFRIAEVAGSLRDAAATGQWLRQLVFRIAVGDNDGHAKNVGILHLPGTDRLTDLYDAVPNLFQPDRIQWNMALAIDGEFDHRRISVPRILAEVASWRVVGARAAEEQVTETLSSLRTALGAVAAPRSASPGMVDTVGRNVDRLLAGDAVGT
jgi:serine/threonine-protein kinase HipA